MSAVARYLSGKVVFVTGATGFLGKGLVEKLLRQAPGLKRLYLPIRLRDGSAGRSLSAQERMVREVWGSNAFENLQKLWGDRFGALMGEKVVAENVTPPAQPR